MSFIQRLFLRILPAALARDMERDSRLWTLACPHCENELSIWELGGIRWKATGNSRNYMKCPACGERGWHHMYKKVEVPVPEAEMEIRELTKKV